MRFAGSCVGCDLVFAVLTGCGAGAFCSGSSSSNGLEEVAAGFAFSAAIGFGVGCCGGDCFEADGEAAARFGLSANGEDAVEAVAFCGRTTDCGVEG